MEFIDLRMHEIFIQESQHEWNKEFRNEKIQKYFKIQNLEFLGIHQTWIPDIPIKKQAQKMIILKLSVLII